MVFFSSSLFPKRPSFSPDLDFNGFAKDCIPSTARSSVLVDDTEPVQRSIEKDSDEEQGQCTVFL